MVEERRIQVGVKDTFLDAVEVEQSDGAKALREAVNITDPEALEARAKVGMGAFLEDYGLVARDPRLDDVVTCLEDIGHELKAIRLHLNIITEFEK